LRADAEAQAEIGATGRAMPRRMPADVTPRH